MTPRVPFNDLRPGEDSAALMGAIARVVDSGWFVLGPEVEAFEREFALACGARHAVGVASGTDAITLLLRSAGIGPGDEVIVPAMTAAFTGLAVASAGAIPVIVDVDDRRMTLDPAAAEAAVTPRTRALVPVHLYGQPADMAALGAVAARHGLAIVEDCCQAHTATCSGTPVGTFGIGGAFSFYPTKNLGAIGDGGAVVTNDSAVADRIRRLRNGGQADRYSHVECGINSRLDELQAAVLRVRLEGLDAATARRRALAARYRAQLPRDIQLECFDPGHVHHLFPVRAKSRNRIQEHLAAAGVQTLIHYPVALSQQEAFLPFRPAPCPRAERAGLELLSLPLYPRLTEAQVSLVAEAVSASLKGVASA